MRGSVIDHVNLANALTAYLSAERLAKFLDLRVTAETERDRFCELMSAAAICGFNFQTDETCVGWTERRVAVFNRQFGRAPQ